MQIFMARGIVATAIDAGFVLPVPRGGPGICHRI
jgi:hypothetical protein